MSLQLSVVIITLNEERNLPRTLESVKPLVADGAGEIIVVDSGSTDRTVEIAKSYGAKVFVEEWKGFAAQKNSAIEKATGEWVLSLDADEAVEAEAVREISSVLVRPRLLPGPTELDLFVQQATGREEAATTHRLWLEMTRGTAQAPALPFEAFGPEENGFYIPRKNFFLGRWVRRGGFWPDPKLRLFRRGKGSVEDRVVHETIRVQGKTSSLNHALLHHAYPTLEVYLEHMRRYADLGAEIIKDKPRWWLWLNRCLNPPLTFFYNYVVRLGFLDGREGFLLHWNHRRYVGWKYAKALELQNKPTANQRG